MKINDCFECVTEEEYKEFVECWFNKDFSCGENVKAELRSSYLLITSHLSDCGCGGVYCSDKLKEVVYTQCYYATNYNYTDTSEVANYQLTPEAYNLGIRNGLLSA